MRAGTHIRAHIHIHTHTNTHRCAQAHTYTHTDARRHTHTRTHTHTHTQTHTDARRHTHTRTHTHTYRCAQAHTYAHTYTHARTHTYTHRRLRIFLAADGSVSLHFLPVASLTWLLTSRITSSQFFAFSTPPHPASIVTLIKARHRREFSSALPHVNTRHRFLSSVMSTSPGRLVRLTN